MIINTAVPISLDNLKKYFADKDNVSYLVDYHSSELKGTKFITYLSNLNVPIDVEGIDEELLKAYMESKALVSCSSLEQAAIEVLFQYKRKESTPFILANKDLITSWVSKLNSLTLYNLYIVQDDSLKAFVTSHEEDTTSGLEGINFVGVLNHQGFFDFYQGMKHEGLKYYKQYFNEYMFKGKSLYEYWANKNNPMFLLMWGIASNNE